MCYLCQTSQDWVGYELSTSFYNSTFTYPGDHLCVLLIYGLSSNPISTPQVDIMPQVRPVSAWYLPTYTD